MSRVSELCRDTCPSALTARRATLRRMAYEHTRRGTTDQEYALQLARGIAGCISAGAGDPTYSIRMGSDTNGVGHGRHQIIFEVECAPYWQTVVEQRKRFGIPQPRNAQPALKLNRWSPL